MAKKKQDQSQDDDLFNASSTGGADIVDTQYADDADADTGTSANTDGGVDEAVSDATDTTDTTTTVAARRPGRRPGQTARPPFQWTEPRERALVQTVYAHTPTDTTECRLTARDLFSDLSDHAAFTSSDIPLTLIHVKDRVERLTARLAKVGETFPKLQPSRRAPIKGLDVDSILKLREEVQGVQGVQGVQRA